MTDLGKILETSVVIGGNQVVLSTYPDNFFDSMVTDPPYGWKFMGKRWDYDVPSVDQFKECYRVLKPGAHILVCCGTRTQHRMAVNIEDAGFEIRDIVGWVYGSGFPKSLDISKAIDKQAGAEREVIGKATDGCGNTESSLHKTNGFAASRLSEYDITAPATDEAKQWDGWGTALKPAMELWTLARKPLDQNTVADNVLTHSTGGLNIDGCRVPLLGEEPPSGSAKRVFASNEYASADHKYGDNTQTPEEGRFPANFIHDGSEEVVSLFPDTKSGKMKQHIEGGDFNVYGKQYPRQVETIGDSGSAARFFYCAKASKSERASSKHPTIKPVALIRYLCKMITPPGGVVLDPWCGSGTTAEAAILEGFGYVVIDMDKTNLKDIEHRVERAERVMRINNIH